MLSLILVLLGLISFVSFRFKLADSSLVFAKEFYSGVQRSLNPSQVNISLEKTDLKIRAKINPADSTNIESFFRTLEIENPGESELDIKLGDQAASYIEKIMLKNNLITDNSRLVNLNLKISTNQIYFDNKKVFGPFDISEENLLDNPSDSGNLRIKELGDSEYLIEIDNPEKVLAEGTLSGKLKLSDNLLDSKWWQILSKLAKINLKVERGVLSASVFLK